MKLKFNNKTIFAIIILSSIFIGIIAINKMPEFPMADSAGYDRIARGLIEDGRYQIVNGNVSPPGYPVFLAGIYSVFGPNYKAVYFIQFILLGIIGCFILSILNKNFQISTAFSFLAALTVVIWPYFILYSSLLLSEILFIFFLYLLIFLLLNDLRRPSLKKSLVIGIIFAAATLTRAVALLLPFWLFGFFLLYLFLKKIENKKQYIFYAIASLAAYLIIITPWILYGSYLKGGFSPVSTNIEEVFHKSNNTYEYMEFKTPGYEPGSEITLSKTMATKLKNIYRFWNPGASGYQAKVLAVKYPATKYLIILYTIIYYIFAALGLLAIVIHAKNKNVLLLSAILLYFWAVHTALYPFPRYTLPVIPIIIILAFLLLANYRSILSGNKIVNG